MATLPNVSQPIDDVLLTAAQRRILAALESSQVQAHSRPQADNGTFWQVFLGVLGMSLLLTGTVLVFFFAALGAVVLVLGGLTLVGALEGAAFVDRQHQADQAFLNDREPPTSH